MAWIKDFWKRLFDKNEWRNMFGNFQTYQNDDGSYSTKYIPSDYSVYSSALGDSSASSFDQETPLIDYLAGLFNSAGQEAQEVRDYNAAQAAAQWGAQRAYRQTYYQDTVKDMEAAGLNPILAAHLSGFSGGQMASASSPMGASDTAAGMINAVSALISAIGQLLPTSATQFVSDSSGYQSFIRKATKKG